MDPADKWSIGLSIAALLVSIGSLLVSIFFNRTRIKKAEARWGADRKRWKHETSLQQLAPVAVKATDAAQYLQVVLSHHSHYKDDRKNLSSTEEETLKS